MQNSENTNEQNVRTAFPDRTLRVIGWTGALMLVIGFGFLKFDVVVHAEGVVEGRAMTRIHAPRDARIAEITAESGDDVRAGDLLMVLVDEELDLELFETRQRLVDAENEIAGARLRLRELELLGTGFETNLAKVLEPLRAEEIKLLEEIGEMYVSLREGGSGSRMEEIQFALRSLAVRQHHLSERHRLELEESGWLEIFNEREQVDLAAAEQRAELLRARLTQLESARERLRVRAPRDGRITRIRFRDPGAKVEAGDQLLSLYRPEEGYMSRMFVADRNVDLIRPGLPVRLDSNVFNASAEGYIQGTVLSMIRDEQAAESGGFEVWVSLDHSPVPPVMGTRLRGEILLQQQGWAGLLRRTPLRERVAADSGGGLTP